MGGVQVSSYSQIWLIITGCAIYIKTTTLQEAERRGVNTCKYDYLNWIWMCHYTQIVKLQEAET